MSHQGTVEYLDAEKHTRHISRRVKLRNMREDHPEFWLKDERGMMLANLKRNNWMVLVLKIWVSPDELEQFLEATEIFQKWLQKQKDEMKPLDRTKLVKAYKDAVKEESNLNLEQHHTTPVQSVVTQVEGVNGYKVHASRLLSGLSVPRIRPDEGRLLPIHSDFDLDVVLKVAWFDIGYKKLVKLLYGTDSSGHLRARHFSLVNVWQGHGSDAHPLCIFDLTANDMEQRVFEATSLLALRAPLQECTQDSVYLIPGQTNTELFLFYTFDTRPEYCKEISNGSTFRMTLHGPVEVPAKDNTIWRGSLDTRTLIVYDSFMSVEASQDLLRHFPKTPREGEGRYESTPSKGLLKLSKRTS